MLQPPPPPQGHPLQQGGKFMDTSSFGTGMTMVDWRCCTMVSFPWSRCQMCYSVVNNYLSAGGNRFDLESGPRGQDYKRFSSIYRCSTQLCPQKWRNFVLFSMVSLRFVLSRVCVFLYSLGPWTIRATRGKETLYPVPIKFAHWRLKSTWFCPVVLSRLAGTCVADDA